MTLSLACHAPPPMTGFRHFGPMSVVRRPVRSIAARFARGVRSAMKIGTKRKPARGRGTGWREPQAQANSRQDLGDPPGDPQPDPTTIFTDYLRSLDPSGKPPSEDAFETVWSALGQALRTELIRRGLWQKPPSYLGVYGFARWSERGTGHGHGDAMEELLADCYTAVFIHRLSALLIQLKTKPHIEWLVTRAIKNFLHDLQKKNDRFGFRVFKILQAAILEALATGELHVLAGDPRIRNTTALGVTLDVDPGSFWDQDLKSIVGSWNDILLPDLITANAKARQRVTADLRRLLTGLPAHGVDGFIVKQVIEPLKNDARTRWRVMLEVEEGDTAIEDGADDEMIQVVRQVHPDEGVEQRDRLRKLSTCIARSLHHLPAPAQTRADLTTLWEYLRTYDDPKVERCQAVQGTSKASSRTHRFPSVRELARLLAISRGRLPVLFKELEHLISACLTTFAESVPGAPTDEGDSAGDGV